MAIQPQLFRAPLDAQGQPRPFAELTLEQQVDLQGQQMLQLQRVIAMQQWQMAASADVQASLEFQSVQLQALALETHEVANVRIINTDQALAEKTMECEAQKARIEMLEAQLASQQAVHAAVKAAAEQTLDTQAKTIGSQREEIAILSKVISSQREEIAILSKVFKKLEEVSDHLSRVSVWGIDRPAVAAVSSLLSQVSETHKELQQNIQSKTL